MMVEVKSNSWHLCRIVAYTDGQFFGIQCNSNNFLTQANVVKRNLYGVDLQAGWHFSAHEQSPPCATCAPWKSFRLSARINR